MGGRFEHVVPVLTDGVVVLNAYTAADVAAHLAGEDEETARRFGWRPHASTEDTVREAFGRCAHDWETAGPTRAFAVREAATDRLVGGCELRLQPDGSAQVSYWTSSAERRRGHATRALTLLLQYARSVGVGQADAEVATDNLASRRVAENAGLYLTSTFTATDGTRMIRYRVRLAEA
ncbi:MAG TPA: GNAT family protein [Actinomycetes bacterium]|nr:GNAT family protein [Actinomycetes bacterium]